MNNLNKGFRSVFFIILSALIVFVSLCVFLLINNRQMNNELNELKQTIISLENPLDDYDFPESSLPEGEKDASEILADNLIISHALGAMDGQDYLNCLEGFTENFEKGIRVFEADFRMTSDDRVVLRHDWRSGFQEGISETHIPTLEEFISKPILGKYTPLSFADLLKLMEKYPDVCIVTDTKFLDEETVHKQFKAMLKEAKELGLTYLFDRMEIQIYSQLHFRIVDSIHHFKNYIYTFYQDKFNGKEEGFRERAEFASQNGIKGVTMNVSVWNKEWISIAEEYGVNVYLHTVNDPEEANELIENGVSAVYTDTLLPSDFKDKE